MALRVIKVKVIVTEDGLEVGNSAIGYYEGQDYEVQVATPDGVDLTVVKAKAGEES